ncbi:hypothetical protein [Pediococcus stilesii]|uniref:Uncharacterized protein n=1 Tax=Pediococcus stilesii TaxID=331679 RepID=A0A0R2KTS1_9LACO|nr:hypothetical protein [Pediococcus stilesii]KRN92921.1 hypothetical protein IV81_GL000991 [Pediococcus stilesii]
MKLRETTKKGSLLIEGVIALIIISGYVTNSLSMWHRWNAEMKDNQIELNYERKILNEIRQKL